MSDDTVSIRDFFRFDLCGKRVLSFLTAKDALSFARTSKENKDASCLSILDPVKLHDGTVPWYGSYSTGDNKYRWKEIHMPVTSHTHSVQFSCIWKDQGSGDRKGRLYIAGSCKSKGSFRDDDVVCCTHSDAEHEYQPLRLRFVPEEGKRYFVWYKVGAGGGHQLYIRNPVVHYLIYDNFEGYLVRQQRALVAKGAYNDAPLFPLLLRAIALHAQRSFTDDGESMIDRSIIDALEDLDLSPSNKNAMDALVVLASSMYKAVRDEESGKDDGKQPAPTWQELDYMTDDGPDY